MSASTLAINGHSSAAGGFVGAALVDGVGDEDEMMLDPSSLLETRLSFFADCFLVRGRKGKRDVFLVLAFRRAGSTAVGSLSTCIS